MKPKSTLSAIGGWNSFFFCVGMYLVALFFSIFVCSSIFYVVNSNKKSDLNDKTATSVKSDAKTASLAYNIPAK
ncbi:MAG TPA: hypothetical protein VG890_01160 [Puia sp.]|nr:hypothetical protein [Puia sp.]